MTATSTTTSSRPRRLATLGLVVGLLALGAPVWSAGPAAAAPAATDEMQQVLTLVNELRASKGIPPMRLCATLTTAALGHAADQAAHNTMSHTGSDGSDVQQRVERAGYTGWASIGENVAFGYATPADVVAAWTRSSGHYANLVSPAFTDMGVARATSASGASYWAQAFGSGGACGQFYDPNPFGSFDGASSPSKGMLSVHGWAVDRDAGAGPIEVHVYVSGVGHNLGPADDFRNGVGAATGLGDHHGFESVLNVPPGNHQVCAYAINAGPGATASLGCKAVWVADPASPFLDLLSSSPFFNNVLWMVRSGYTTGYADGNYRPLLAVSRQTMAAFLWRASGSPKGPFPDPGFSDISPNHPFYTPIAWMVDAKITTGFADGTFKPTLPIARQSAALFLWRMQGSPPVPDGAPEFGDVPANHLFRNAIRWAASVGITTGYPDGTFRPATTVNRQTVAAFLYRWKSLPT